MTTVGPPPPRRRTAADRAVPYRVVGQSPAHHDFVDKVKGALHYAADWRLPGMLHGRIVRSQLPSARITGIDVSAARALPGVVAVLTAADVPSNRIVEMASGGLAELEVSMPVLASDRVRYLGEPVALVAAATQQIAAEAAELVSVDYEELPGVFDVESARADGAPRVHEVGNTLVSWQIRCGDAGRGAGRRRRGGGGRVPEPARRARLPRARGRGGLGGERRADAPRVHPGHRARGHDRAHPAGAAEQGQGDRRVHGRRLRRQGGHDGRAVPGAAGLAHPAAGADDLGPAGVAGRQHQAAPVHHALPDRGDQRRHAHRAAGRDPRRRRCLPEPVAPGAVRRGRLRVRALPGAERQHHLQRGVHQQRAVQRVPRVRRHADRARLRVADGRARRAPRHVPDRAARAQLPGQGRPAADRGAARHLRGGRPRPCTGRSRCSASRPRRPGRAR